MRLVLALTADTEEHLLGAAIASGHEIVARPAGSTELAAAIVSTRPDAVLVSALPVLLSGSVIAAAEEVACRLVAVADGSAEYTHAAALGVREVLDASARWRDAEAAMTGASSLAEPVPAGAAEGAGRIVAVWGPTGAPGRTSLAIAFAAELTTRGLRVALVDADTYGASVAVSLGLLDEAPGLAAACRLAGSGGLDLAQLDRVAAHVPTRSGRLRVLTGITRPSRWPELSHDRMVDTLTVARSWADVVVVDTGFNLEADEEIVSDLFAPRRNASTLAVLESADLVVAVGSADPIGLARLIRGHAELAELVARERVAVMVNRLRRGPVGTNAGAQIADTLGRFANIDEVSFVPYDRAAFDAALLAAGSLPEIAPKSAATAAIGGFVRERLVPLLDAETMPHTSRASRFAPPESDSRARTVQDG